MQENRARQVIEDWMGYNIEPYDITDPLLAHLWVEGYKVAPLEDFIPELIAGEEVSY